MFLQTKTGTATGRQRHLKDWNAPISYVLYISYYDYLRHEKKSLIEIACIVCLHVYSIHSLLGFCLFSHPHLLPKTFKNDFHSIKQASDTKKLNDKIKTHLKVDLLEVWKRSDAWDQNL